MKYIRVFCGKWELRTSHFCSIIDIFKSEGDLFMGNITSLQAAKKWNISKRQVNLLCAKGLIPGAKMENSRWMIPDDFVYHPRKQNQNMGYPNRISGKYINIGNEGFASIRNSEYVDKSKLISFVNACLNTPQKLICVSRPRRFGKSFATKMLCAYYSRSCDSLELFEDLAIAKDISFRNHLNRYDVLYLDITLFLSTMQQNQQLVDRMETAIIEDLAESYPVASGQHNLIDALRRINEFTENKMILIIDEWDALFRECKGQDALLDRYIMLLRSLFKSSLTDRLFAGVYMTGILPIKKYGHESAVSDFYEYSMVEPRPLQTYIGFTEEEVCTLCKKYHMDFQAMKKWYDGYCVGDVHIYNPKSVMESILRNKYSNYWTKTETYEALRDYIDMNFDGLKDTIINMLGENTCKVDTGSFQNDMTSMKSRDDVLTLLIHLGYLAYDEKNQTVCIPNTEIKEEFIRAIRNGNRKELMKAVIRSDALLSATWSADGERAAEIIGDIHNEETAIDFYNNEQALRSIIKTAYLSSIDHYTRMEELPAGKGYADIIFWPRRETNHPPIIVELKWNKTENAALQQMKEKNYPAALSSYKGDILLVGVAYNVKTKKHSCVIEKITK